MSRTDLMRGTLDLLILRALVTGPNHGLGIARRVEQITQGRVPCHPGLALSRAASARTEGVAEGGVGAFGDQSEGEILRIDLRRPPARDEEARNWKRVSVAIELALRDVGEA